MANYHVNNQKDLIKIIKISMIRDKMSKNTDIDYDLVEEISKEKGISKLFKTLKSLHLKMLIEE